MTAVTQNALYQSRLGWTASELGIASGLVGTVQVDAIKIRQRELQVTPDGVAGPMTYSRALAAMQAKLATSPWPDDGAKMIAAGLVAYCEAKRAWLTDIIDLPEPTAKDFERCRSFIDAVIRSPIGSGWSWRPPYIRDTFEWCGTFAAFAWNAAGLKMFDRKYYFPSNYRLDCWGRYIPFDDHAPNPRPTVGPPRQMIELDEHSVATDARFSPTDLPRPGDILTVGGVDTAYGKHICLVEKFEISQGVGIFTTIEGNGTGFGPNGEKQHGVVRAYRYVGLQNGAPKTTYFARRLIRPAPSDLV